MTQDEIISDDMADEVKTENAEAAKYRRQKNQYKAKAAELEKQVASLLAERDAALNEAASLKKTIEEQPSAEAARIAELESKIRTRDHRDAFNRLSDGKIRSDAVEAAWTLSGWQADADDIDEDKMGETVANLVASHPFLAAEDAAMPKSGETDSPQATRSSGRLNSPSPVPGLGRAPANKSDANKELIARVPNPSRLI